VTTPTPKELRVVIADDTALLRNGIARMLAESDIEVAGLARDGTEAVALVEREQPDVAILDIKMPPTHTDEGLVAADEIRRRFPTTGVLILSQYVESAYALRLIEGGEGHAGYLLKDRVLDSRHLAEAIGRVAAGETVVDPELVATLIDGRREDSPLDKLTNREREVLQLMAEGLTDRGIGKLLWLTPRTVETHIRHILQKLDLPDDADHNRRVHAVLAYLRG
jgi:DNA-binding NarL/FixJ family response regulator